MTRKDFFGAGMLTRFLRNEHDSEFAERRIQ
jgi:hypothetical protein